ncbi:hypothetical protein [uncultured Roseobacter sp.]|uniref:hypothetical protein n=1 Tax=uncultured Roseobacter sp. TaxID=114847 RepID=UPI002618FA67|nr:hypothetical protein [uncultured Roseobacter sp.]
MAKNIKWVLILLSILVPKMVDIQIHIDIVPNSSYPAEVKGTKSEQHTWEQGSY